MEENKKKVYVDRDIISIKINFDEVDNWRKPGSDDLPVYSFLSFYSAIGLDPYIKEYCESEEGRQIVALDNILCNFNTLKRIKEYVQKQWKIYSLDINSDYNVVWDESIYKKGEKHYAKRLKKKIEKCLALDLSQYCPGLDDELEDDVVVFRVFDLKEKEEENEQEQI